MYSLECWLIFNSYMMNLKQFKNDFDANALIELLCILVINEITGCLPFKSWSYLNKEVQIYEVMFIRASY